MTLKESIVITCPADHYTQMSYLEIVLMSVVGFTFLTTALWIVFQVLHLYREMVSKNLHAEYVRKKEIEYEIGLSEMWRSRHFWAFSSFKSHIMKMYHRPLFNLYIWTFVAIHVLTHKYPTVQISCYVIWQLIF